MRQSFHHKAIVIGSSAGGLAALSLLLEKLPADYPLPVIIVQHRVPDERDLLEELLQSKCSIRVKQADEKEPIENATVYIAPPGYHLLIEADKTFSLSVDKPVNFSRPSVNVLFETAAATFGTALIGIVLTGANQDGAEGIRMISNKGGLTIAQDPEEAEFPSMPASAIATKKIDHVWPLVTIQHFLLKLSDHEN